MASYIVRVILSAEGWRRSHTEDKTMLTLWILYQESVQRAQLDPPHANKHVALDERDKKEHGMYEST